MNLTSNFVLGSTDGRYALQYLISNHGLINSKFLNNRRRCSSLRDLRKRMLRVYCDSSAREMQTRKCSPFLESRLLSGNGALPNTEWKAVPDIWRSTAEKFGDRIALVDPYHDPPTNLSYMQLEQEILNFSEGLRVIGVNPGEKVALFADNSCRWLVADQGTMATGAVNVVRGSRSSVEELLQYIVILTGLKKIPFFICIHLLVLYNSIAVKINTFLLFGALRKIGCILKNFKADRIVGSLFSLIAAENCYVYAM